LTAFSIARKVHRSPAAPAAGPRPTPSSGTVPDAVRLAVGLPGWACGSACADAGQVLTKSPPGPNWHNGMSLIKMPLWPAPDCKGSREPKDSDSVRIAVYANIAQTSTSSSMFFRSGWSAGAVSLELMQTQTVCLRPYRAIAFRPTLHVGLGGYRPSGGIVLKKSPIPAIYGLDSPLAAAATPARKKRCGTAQVAVNRAADCIFSAPTGFTQSSASQAEKLQLLLAVRSRNPSFRPDLQSRGAVDCRSSGAGTGSPFWWPPGRTSGT